MKHLTLALFLISFVFGLGGCASSNKASPSASSASNEESRIVGNIPPDSPFAKVKLGMTQGMVHEVVGQPNDTINYTTGKMWIPFYFGPDVTRLEEMYKGLGRITYTGAGIGGVNYKVYRVVYDPTEDGHPDR